MWGNLSNTCMGRCINTSKHALGPRNKFHKHVSYVRTAGGETDYGELTESECPAHGGNQLELEVPESSCGDSALNAFTMSRAQPEFDFSEHKAWQRACILMNVEDSKEETMSVAVSLISTRAWRR
jgi:hypothetical protein